MNTIKNTLLLTTILAFAACSQAPQNQNTNNQIEAQSQDSNIVNGAPVLKVDPISQATVALYVEQSEGRTVSQMNFCTGTLIAEDVVLTAAHCFADFAEEMNESVENLSRKVSVGFGLPVVKSNRDKKVEFRTIKSVVVHPEYKVGAVEEAFKTPMKDVALIYLNDVAPKTARPAKLLQDASVLKKGTELTLAGYGLVLAFPFSIQAKRLMKVNVTIDNPALTEVQFTYMAQNSRGSCSGDSGGPAYLVTEDDDLIVAGVTSWGDFYCQSIGAYTSVPAMHSWIEETIQALKNPEEPIIALHFNF